MLIFSVWLIWHTEIFCLPCQCISKCFLTSSSILPTYCFNTSGWRNDTRTPHACAHVHSIPGYSSHRKSFLPIMDVDWQVCYHHKYRWTYLQPVHEGTLLGSQRSSFFKWGRIFLFYPEAIYLLCFMRMARRKLRLWPMMGNPKETGGSLFELFLIRRR